MLVSLLQTENRPHRTIIINLFLRYFNNMSKNTGNININLRVTTSLAFVMAEPATFTAVHWNQAASVFLASSM
jgi:hypothetical protein